MTSPLRRDAMRTVLANRQGYLLLDQSAYRRLGEDGWTRTTIDQAVDDLVELGEVEIVASNGPLMVRALEGAT
jgi:hypothetical protein